MKIVVLAGGTSTEREVSIVSGTGVCKALRSFGHQAVLMDVFFGLPREEIEGIFSRPYDVDAAAEQMRRQSPLVREEMERRRYFAGPSVVRLCRDSDIVFLALHGANGEDGRLQALLDLYGVKYTGPDYLSCALAMDKERTKQLFRSVHVPTPDGVMVWSADGVRDAEEFGMHFPLIVKPCLGGSSVGVSIVNSNEELHEALRNSFSLEPRALIEEYISGREFSVAVIGDVAYPVIEIAPKHGFYDYRNKYEAGSTVETCPAQISEESTSLMQKYAVTAAEILGIQTYVRFDFMMRENGEMFCLEANPLPGMTPTSLVPQEAAALGMSYPELCEKLIEVSIEKYQGKTSAEYQ